MKRVLDKIRETRGNMNFTESLALKVVSLLLALILWITILGFKREELVKSIAFEPLLPPNRALINRVPTHIQVTFEGPRVLLKELEKKLQPFQPDFRFNQENRTVKLSEEMVDPPIGVRVKSIEPAEVSIRMEEVLEKQVQVRANLIGSPPDGYELGQVTVSPSTVAITGPKSTLESLSFILTEPLPVEDLTQNERRELAVEVDARQGLQLSRQKVVTVRIAIKKAKARK